MTVDEEISFKEGIPVLEFHFIGGKYHITVPDKIEEVPIILSDRYNSEDEEITEDTIVEYERVYRILIEDYLLVIGGDIILYGTI